MISILLAVYNNEPYLAQLIDSILAQSVGEFRLYIRDDCSQDGSFAVASAYQGKDSRVFAVRSESPSGSAQNNFFRLLLEHEDDYLMFADADDVWLPDKIERTLEKMREIEDACGAQTPVLVHTDAEVTDGALGVLDPSLFHYEGLSPERRSLRNLLAQNNVTGCTAMINRALRGYIRTRPREAVMHDWWAALVAAAFGEIGVVYAPTMLYRQHGDNSVGAYRASDPALAFKKLANGARTRAVYDSMFRQAACFAETYRAELTPEQYALCAAYGAMLGKGKAAKIGTVVKYGFYKNTLVRNLGQFVAI